MTDLIFKGKVSLENKQRDSFIRAFNDLLVSYNAQFSGEVKSFEFDDCEIIEDEETSN